MHVGRTRSHNSYLLWRTLRGYRVQRPEHPFLFSINRHHPRPIYRWVAISKDNNSWVRRHGDGTYPLKTYLIYRRYGMRVDPRHYASIFGDYTHGPNQVRNPILGGDIHELLVMSLVHPPTLQPPGSLHFTPLPPPHAPSPLHNGSPRGHETERGFSSTLRKIRALTNIRGNEFADLSAKLAVADFNTLPPEQSLRMEVG
jgi:hypothetical protein